MSKYKSDNMSPIGLGGGFGIGTPFFYDIPPKGVVGKATIKNKKYTKGDVVMEASMWKMSDGIPTKTAYAPSTHASISFTVDIDDTDSRALLAIVAVNRIYRPANFIGGASNLYEDSVKYDAQICDYALSLGKSVYEYYLVAQYDNYKNINMYGQIITDDNKRQAGFINAGINNTIVPEQDTTTYKYDTPLNGFYYENRYNGLTPQDLKNAMAEMNDSRLEFYTDIRANNSKVADFMTQDYTKIIYDDQCINNADKLAFLYAAGLYFRFFSFAIISNSGSFDSFIVDDVKNREYAVATSIDTNLPVFVLNDADSVDNLIKYLSGEDFTPDNAEDLAMSALDLNTDWTIYVKGARKPNIYITEVSKGIEDFIKSDANTTGLTAKDFKIQYRCPFWEENKTESLQWDKTDVTIPFLSQYYDYVYQTSYNDLIHVNYGGDFDIEAIQDMAFDVSNPAEMPYAQMQFRIYLNDKKYSSWCEFGIGYIGSPTITDFDKQSNWGIVKGINDNSTVTILYDEYPEGYAPDDYTKPPDDSDPDITDNGGTQVGTANNGLSLLTTSYAVTDANLKELGNFLWTATIFDDIRLINNSPLDNIVSVKIMPIGLTGSSVSLKIGNIDTEINAEKIDNVPLLTVGSLEWRGYYGNFLDYAPYTQAYIFLPFIGFYEIDPAQCVGHELTVKYAFDIIVGQCKAFLFVDNIYYTSFEGQCGVDVPLVSTNRAQLESGLLASTVTSVLTANPLPLIMQAINSQYQSQRSGAYSATLGWAETRRCFVVFMIPNSQYPRSYGHDYGYPCNLTYNLGQLSGFTQTIQDPDISGIPCTQEEGEMIKSMLSSGVYL